MPTLIKKSGKNRPHTIVRMEPCTGLISEVCFGVKLRLNQGCEKSLQIDHLAVFDERLACG